MNHRSGGDVWYSDMLTSCREGNMSMTDWQFLHGLPTEECGSWLAQQEKSMCGKAACSHFAETTKTIRFEGLEEWKKKVFKFECEICAGERKRRHRVLPMLSEKTDAHSSDD